MRLTMRFLVPFAALMLASCGLPGTGPAQWTTMPPIKLAELEEPAAGTRPPPPEVMPAARPAAAAAAAPVEAEADEAPADAAAAPSAARPAAQAARPSSDVEALREIALSSAQVRAVQAGVRDALHNDSARVDRMVAGQNSLGVVFVCGYAEGGGADGRQAFRGVLMGKDQAQPKFVPVSSSGASAEQQATAQLCAEQGIPLAAAVEVASAPPAGEPAAAETALAAAEPAAAPVAEAGPAIAAAPAVPPAPAAAAAPATPLPRVVLTEPQITIIQAGVKNSLKAPSLVFGRMLAAADAKGGIVVCGYVNPTGGEGGTGIQPFTGVLIGNGDSRNFVPVSFGRDDVEKRQTMQVCAGQGIPL